MSNLGNPVTKKFSIGTAELRIGPLSLAGKLTSANSIGLIDLAQITIGQTSVDLMGGFPQQIVDTAITQQESSITATLREFSRRNIQLMVGGGISDLIQDTASLVTSSAAKGGTSLTVTTGEGSLFAVGDTVVVYPDGEPENVTVDIVTAIAGDVLTIEKGLNVAVDGTASTVHIYKGNPVSVGGLNKTNYFAVTLVQAENSSGRPLVFDCWKASFSGDFSLATSSTDFASGEITIKILQPASTEYAAGGELEHLASVIAAYPTARYTGGGDL